MVCRNIPDHPSTQICPNMPSGIVLEYDHQRIGPKELESASYPSTIISVKNMKPIVGISTRTIAQVKADVGYMSHRLIHM